MELCYNPSPPSFALPPLENLLVWENISVCWLVFFMLRPPGPLSRFEELSPWPASGELTKLPFFGWLPFLMWLECNGITWRPAAAPPPRLWLLMWRFSEERWPLLSLGRLWLISWPVLISSLILSGCSWSLLSSGASSARNSCPLAPELLWCTTAAFYTCTFWIFTPVVSEACAVFGGSPAPSFFCYTPVLA